MKTDRLDKAVSYFLDTLMAYKNIVGSGCCNDCKRKECEYMPDPGQLVRYNCPFYEQKEGEG